MPDLILLDIEMPSMNGFDVINILKADARHANIPVIFLTSRGKEIIVLISFYINPSTRLPGDPDINRAFSWSEKGSTNGGLRIGTKPLTESECRQCW